LASRKKAILPVSQRASNSKRENEIEKPQERNQQQQQQQQYFVSFLFLDIFLKVDQTQQI
jgi:hypothetical protein